MILNGMNFNDISFLTVKGFYVPKVYWGMTTSKILVLEWIDGIPFSNKKAILNTDFDKKIIAKNLVISYFTQIYGNGFFHADMHQGNLFLLKNGDIAVVDFGIMGKINKKTRIAVAEIVLGFINRDYKTVAQVHIDAGLVPSDTDVDNLAIYFSRSVIPFHRDKDINVKYYKHKGVYAFRKQALLDFYKTAITPLEAAEKIEAIRYQEIGKKIKMVETDIEAVGIDTPEDLEKAIQFLKL